MAPGAPVLDAAAELDARACSAVVNGVDELRALERETPAPEFIAWLAALPVTAGQPSRPGAVLIADPLSIRARRFAAVVVAGLQEGEFPRGVVPDPFLSDELRRELSAASGLRLRLAEDPLARERYLLYACVSRATRRLVLSYRSSDEEGNLALPSPFLRDVADLLDAGWWERRRRRLLADVVWAPDEAPTEHERRRAQAAAAPLGRGRARGAPAVARRAGPRPPSGDRLSRGAGVLCRLPGQLAGRAPAQPRGAATHARAAGSRLASCTTCSSGVLRALDGPITPENLARARALLDEHLRALPDDVAAGSPPGVRAAALRMIAADLHRYLETEARSGADWRPVAFEQRFGFDDDDASLPALELVDGRRARAGAGRHRSHRRRSLRPPRDRARLQERRRPPRVPGQQMGATSTSFR